jgi:hypothetical protein
VRLIQYLLSTVVAYVACPAALIRVRPYVYVACPQLLLSRFVRMWGSRPGSQKLVTLELQWKIVIKINSIEIVHAICARINFGKP